jgi:hypothetical protein
MAKHVASRQVKKGFLTYDATRQHNVDGVLSTRFLPLVIRNGPAKGTSSTWLQAVA